jgi:hypothetical protein
VHHLIVPHSVDDIMLQMLATKQAEFNDYARESLLADGATTAKDKNEESMAKVIVLEKRKRLGNNSQEEVKLEDFEE